MRASGDLYTPNAFSPACWYAIHTRSHHERKVNTELSRLGFEVFLPEYQTWSHRRDRRKRILKPLFPGYLFVRSRLDSPLRVAILRAPSVVRIVGTGHRPVPVPEHEVKSIQLLLGTEPSAGPRSPLTQGQKVQVMEGPLRGVVGRVENTAEGKRIVVTVELLGRAVAATLDTDAVAPYLD